MKACLVVADGHSYTTIHTNQEFMNSIDKHFDREIYNYFAKHRDRGTPHFENDDVCWLVGSWKYEQYNKTYWMITDGEKYSIIGRKGILIEGKNNNKKFFDFIFKGELNDL